MHECVRWEGNEGKRRASVSKDKKKGMEGVNAKAKDSPAKDCRLTVHSAHEEAACASNPQHPPVTTRTPQTIP